MKTILAAGLAGLLSVSAAGAADVTHFTDLNTGGAPAASAGTFQANNAEDTASTSWDAPFIWNNSSTVQDAAFAGAASANLTEGTLRTTSEVENRTPTSGPLLAPGERSHQNSSQARFGDTFSISTADPNVAVAGGTAFITLNIEGAFVVPGGVDFASTYDQFGSPQPYNMFSMDGSLRASAVGTFDLVNQAQNLNPDDFVDFDAYYAAFLALNDQITANRIGQSTISYHSNQQYIDEVLIGLLGLDPSRAILASNGPLSTTIMLEIALNGALTEFEWEASLFSMVMLDSSVTNAFLGANFGNTATLNVVLPEGYSFSSASGAFPTSNVIYTAVVPAPASWALMICAFGLVAAAMRRQGLVRV